MLFWSRYAAWVHNVRSPVEIMHPTLPKKIGEVTALSCEFGQHLGEGDVVDPTTGGVIRVAEIRGHYFDTVAAQETKGWTDEEREEVETSLLAECLKQPTTVRLVDTPKVGPPVPTYDTINHNRLVAMMTELGLVSEALAYEQQERNRPSVVAGYQAYLEQQAAERAAEEALTV